MAAAIAPLTFTGAASALLAYDDDEEMVEKAKANRAKRLKEVSVLCLYWCDELWHALCRLCQGSLSECCGQYQVKAARVFSAVYLSS